MNKKLQPLIIYFLIALTFTIVGCSKENRSNLEPQKTKNQGQGIALKIDQNQNNEWNYIGEEFAYALDSIGQSNFFSNPSNQLAYDVVTAYLDDNLKSSNDLSFNEAEDHLKNGIPDTIANKADFSALNPNYFNNYVKANTSLSSGVDAYLDSLNNAYQDYNSESGFVNQLEDIEQDIQDANDLASDEEDALLAGFAIARNSIVYLEDAQANSDHNWNGDLNANLSYNQIEPFILNLSHYGIAQYFIAFNEKVDNSLTLDDRIHSGNVQTAFNIGPLTTDSGNNAY